MPKYYHKIENMFYTYSMSESMVIEKGQARRFVLAHSGLLPPRQLSGKEGVYDFIRRVNCIQYDPINVVGQNPHVVLQSRVDQYKPKMLESLLYEDRKLVEGFDKMMAVYPVEDWPDFAYYREQMARQYMENKQTAAAAKLVDRVRAEIEKRGPLSSLDLKDETRMDWWLTDTVRAVRISMDILFYAGEIAIHHRVGTRRYFDLSERILPPELVGDLRWHSTQEEYLQWHILRRAGGLGLLMAHTGQEYGGMHGWRGGRIKEAIKKLTEKDMLIPISIAGLKHKGFYIRPDDLPTLETASKTRQNNLRAAFIAPFDNLMWNRKLVKLLFGFDYGLEIYRPEARRSYGYYVLPVLYGEQLVARMDPGFDRQGKTFTINGWWWEDGVDPEDKTMQTEIEKCLQEFGKYLEAKQFRLGKKVTDTYWLKQVIKNLNNRL